MSSTGPQTKSFCAPAYTPHQVARAILNEAACDPNISAKTIGALVRAKQIYRRQPPDSHYRSVRKEIMRHFNACRAVDMVGLEGYAELFRKYGNTVRIYIINGVQMNEQRVKAAQHIFKQCKKAKKLPSDATFDRDVIDMTDISDDGRY
ncbi:hypothetical protein BWQ96_09129 [Gracilariopsis chorda]|uniref:Uncharacterized protein n=1 Tax=Gracilariopsis chorda TaxID=448386 RepID=A0A2V3IGI3_9FLOR|nr:hypothetical protein BWQ96_09129 [Gracilariopsis chorda]|eukprot:PXF41162.1 hypothetical protein BWQ96_09129 [Gracilariopsis chorda]